MLNSSYLSEEIIDNFSQFYYNPISLTKSTRKYFPNLLENWIYSKEDEIFVDGKITKIVFFNEITQKEAEEIIEELEKKSNKLLFFEIKNSFCFSSLFDEKQNFQKEIKLKNLFIEKNIFFSDEKCFEFLNQKASPKMCYIKHNLTYENLCYIKHFFIPSQTAAL